MRQSSPHPVLTTQESLRLQYALQPRALHRGWRPADVDSIDADWGRSATATQHREGCKALVTTLTLGQVGLLLSYEVTRRAAHGELVWKQPTVAALLATLQHPAYAGAFVYGRTTQVRKESSPRAASPKRRPIHPWNIRVHDQSPASMRWETFEQIQAMLQDHAAEYDRNTTRGIPRPGAALLHGRVYWGECGHTRLVPYQHATRDWCHDFRPQ